MEIAEDGSQRSQHVTFDWRAAESVTAAVVSAVASVSGEDVLEVEQLHDVIDPDSLNSLFQRNDRQREMVLEFHYNGCRVQVSASGKGYVYQTD